jgi:hypothetical protein
MTNKVNLLIGDYPVAVWVNDTFAHTASAAFVIHVRDTVPPAWIIEPVDQFLQLGEPLDYQVPAADASGISQWVINDTAHFALRKTDWVGGSTAHITNATVLNPGRYSLSITVFDAYGNELTANFVVTVNAVALPPPIPGYPAESVMVGMITATCLGLFVAKRRNRTILRRIKKA